MILSKASDILPELFLTFFMAEFFQAILYQPIFNGFVALYNIVPDVGVVILVITLIIKAVLYPLTNKSIKAQKSLTELQPKMQELKEKYKSDQQKLAQETMKLYKEHKVNPFGSCLPLLIQLPIFLALYWVLRDVFIADKFHLLYPFVSRPEELNPVTLGLFNLAHASVILALFAGAAQFWQARMFSTKRTPAKAGAGGKDEDMMAMMNKQMIYIMPIMTVLIGFQLPAGLTLYWFLSTLLTGLQQAFLFKKHNGPEKETGVIEGELVEKK